MYDGLEDGVFNLSNQSLFTYECMFAYWDLMLLSGATYYSYW